MEKAISIISKSAGSLQETLLQQHRRKEELKEKMGNVSESVSSVQNVCLALAALGVEQEKILWLSKLNLQNPETDLLFIGALLVFGRAGTDALELAFQNSPVSYEQLQTAVFDDGNTEQDPAVKELLEHLLTEQDSSRKEFTALVSEIREAIRKNRSAASKSNNDDIRAGYEMMKRVIGQAHLTEDSPTYEETAQMVKEMQQEIQSLKAQHKTLSDSAKKKDADLTEYRKEILHIRQLYRKQQEQTAVRKASKKSRSIWQKLHRKTNLEKDRSPFPQYLSATSVETFFSYVVRDESFTDDQLRLISQAIHDKILSLDDLKELANPQLTNARMTLLLDYLYFKHGIRRRHQKELTDIPLRKMETDGDQKTEPLKKREALLKTIQPEYPPVMLETADTSAETTSSAVRIRSIAERVAGRSGRNR